jgi:RsiW-degrading membrane proteinase PrsW (M82 family)
MSKQKKRTLAGISLAIWDHSLTAFFVYVVIPSLLIILGVNLFISRPAANTPQQLIALAMRAQDFGEARNLYMELLEKDPYQIEHHRGHINSHFNIAKRSGKHTTRNDDAIVERYEKYASSSDTALRDIGHYGLGLIAVLQNDYDRGLVEYGQVTDNHLPYLNNSIGYACLKLSRPGQAEEAFRRELILEIPGDTVRGNVNAAVNNLSDLYIKTKEVNKLAQLASDGRYRRFLPNEALRYVSFHKAEPMGYLANYFKAHLINPIPAGVMAAVLIAALWFFYFVKLDVFEPEKYGHLLLALAAGAVASLATSFIYDVDNYLLGFRFGGGLLDQLAYCVLGIGLIEETVKIAPALLLYRYNKQVDEPLDLLIYGSLTALGFALMENIQYFHQAGLSRITGRAVTASLLHMSLTSIALFGLVRTRFLGKGHKYLVPLGTFALACLIHGLYDLFLISDSWLSNFRIFSTIILLFTAMAFGHILNTCINRSPFFDQSRVSKLKDLARYLGFGLCGVIMLQYVIVAINLGPIRANRDIVNVVMSLYFIIWVVSVQLGNFRIRQGQDIPIFDNKKRI